jgi:hypothetical protein
VFQLPLLPEALPLFGGGFLPSSLLVRLGLPGQVADEIMMARKNVHNRWLMSPISLGLEPRPPW